MIDTFVVAAPLPRSGTSMMMRSLTVGGLTPLMDPERDKINATYGDEFYKINPDGFYEVGHDDFNQDGFPAQHRGKLIKMLRDAPLRLNPELTYRLVMMWRHPTESRESYKRALDTGADEHTANNYWSLMSGLVADLSARDNFKVTNFWFRDVVAEPEKHFQILADRGWPIDVQAAATVPTEEQVRCRWEDSQAAWV